MDKTKLINDIRNTLVEINDKESLDMFEEIKDKVDDNYLNNLFKEVTEVSNIIKKDKEVIQTETRRKKRKLTDKTFNKCSICESNCRKFIKQNDGSLKFFCCKHHPESIKKRGENQMRYYKTDKGLEAYTRVYLNKRMKKQASN